MRSQRPYQTQSMQPSARLVMPQSPNIANNQTSFNLYPQQASYMQAQAQFH